MCSVLGAETISINWWVVRWALWRHWRCLISRILLCHRASLCVSTVICIRMKLSAYLSVCLSVCPQSVASSAWPGHDPVHPNHLHIRSLAVQYDAAIERHELRDIEIGFEHQTSIKDILRTGAKFKQVAQLSQRDRATGWVSYGQTWKTGTGRQYLRIL